ncbi:helix-turn-helix domain-containing protein [Vibrio parahaemolyticus]|uniref:helix-turn-helix domain-containing protein n=1 Tax=Vibrio parahaemolyticus TaxID=670 RepID=UPI001F3F8C1D|nr:helix-turn-helix domain-containing protein [Vibrio parahaemolyticus]
MVRDLVFQEALRRTHGNRSKAARMLGVSRNQYCIHLARIDVHSVSLKGKESC